MVKKATKTPTVRSAKQKTTKKTSESSSRKTVKRTSKEPGVRIVGKATRRVIAHSSPVYTAPQQASYEFRDSETVNYYEAENSFANSEDSSLAYEDANELSTK